MFLGYIHTFRALAIFFIVAGHSIDFFQWPGKHDLEYLLRIVMSNGSVLFVFIAGYLFQHLAPKFSLKKYYVSKLQNVIVPDLLISIPAIIIFTTGLERHNVWPGFYDEPVWKQVLLFYLTGKHLTPFWFVPMIAVLYLVAPLLVRLDRVPYFYTLLPVFIILSWYVGRGLPYVSALHFFSAYMLGMFCSHYKSSINNRLASGWFILACLALLAALIWTEFNDFQNAKATINYQQKLVMSMFWLAVLIRFDRYLTAFWVSTIAATSFGVFFVHAYWLAAVKLLIESAYGRLPVGSVW